MCGLYKEGLTIFWQCLHFYDSKTMLSILAEDPLSDGNGTFAVLIGEGGALKFPGRSRRGEGGQLKVILGLLRGEGERRGERGRINRQIIKHCLSYVLYNIIMKGRELLVQSANSQILQESYGSSVPLKGIVAKTDSILFQSNTAYNNTGIKDNNHKPSLMGNVPLLLQKRKQGIIQDNMVDNDPGLQKWRFGKMIGGGGSGRVYRALNSLTGCLYAVKKVHLCQADEQQCKTQINILSKISHDNIVRYVQHYHLPEETLIFMEYVPGTLKKFYKDFGPPPLETYLYFAKQLIIALDYLHEHKIMHKDLKCANILLTNKGILKLSDFGCSKDFQRTLSFINYQVEGSKTQKGTPHWMAPESIIDAIYNVKTDVWGLGCTLLQLATGNAPWAEKNLDSHKIMMYIGSKNQVPAIPETLPQVTQQLIKKCLVREPQQRSSLKELLLLLQRHQH